MSATSGTFDSQFTAENSTFWAENEKKTKLKMHFRPKTKLAETTINRHFRRRKQPFDLPGESESGFTVKLNLSSLNNIPIVLLSNYISPIY